MRKRWALFVLSCLLAFVPTTVTGAEALSAKTMYKACKSASETMKMACDAYFIGFTRGMHIGIGAGNRLKPICPKDLFEGPKSIVVKKVRDTFVKYFERSGRVDGDLNKLSLMSFIIVACNLKRR